MKKFVLPVVLFTAIAMAGCGNTAQEGNNNTAQEVTETTVAESGEAVSEGSLDELYTDAYVTLGEYKGLEATYDVKKPGTDDIEGRIKSDLSSMVEKVEVTDRPVKTGDIVNIDYEGKKDGVAFVGGTAAGYDLTIGSGAFIPGFEEGLIGANLGDTVDLNLTFPEQYHSEELAGADVIFTVKVNSITEEKIPELTDEIVANIGDGYENVDAYKKAVEEDLANSFKAGQEMSAKNELMNAAVANATVNEVPEWLLKELTASVRSSAENYAMTFGISLEDFVSQALNETMDAFEAECAQYGRENAEKVLVVYAIANKENLKLDDEEIKSSMDEYMAEYGLSEEEMEMSGQKNYMLEYIQNEKVAKFLLDNASLKDNAGNAVKAEE